MPLSLVSGVCYRGSPKRRGREQLPLCPCSLVPRLLPSRNFEGNKVTYGRYGTIYMLWCYLLNGIIAKQNKYL